MHLQNYFLSSPLNPCLSSTVMDHLALGWLEEESCVYHLDWETLCQWQSPLVKSCLAWVWPPKICVSGIWLPGQQCWEVGWLGDRGGTDFMNKLTNMWAPERRGSLPLCCHSVFSLNHMASSAMLGSSRKALARGGPWSWPSQSPKLEVMTFCPVKSTQPQVSHYRSTQQVNTVPSLLCASL